MADLGERCAALPLEQAQNLGLLAAVARCGGLVALDAFPLGSFGISLAGLLVGRRDPFRRAVAVQALDRFPDARPLTCGQ